MVASGVDPEFNALRVLPPAELEYPDLMRDGMDFYDMINCPHLKSKYNNDADGDDVEKDAAKRAMA